MSYSREYGRRSARYGRRRNYQRRLELLQRFLPDAAGFGIDLGSADGDYAGDMQSHGYRIICLDVSREALLAARYLNQADCIRASATSVPIADGSVDFVYILNALRVFPNPRSTILEASRCLSDGGLLFVACHTLLSIDILFAPRENVRYLTQWEVEAMLREAGLETVAQGHVPSIPASATPSSEELLVRVTEALSATPLHIFLPEFYFVARKDGEPS